MSYLLSIKVPVIAGTGSNNTHASIDLTKKATEVGVDAVMLVAPYYNKPSQEGMYQHFKAIAESTPLPVMLYNVPGRSIVQISVDTVVRLSEIENIVAIKDAGGDVLTMTEIIEKTADDFAVYSGDDGLTLPAMAVGAKGIVSVASHVIGNEMQEMIAAFQAGEFKKAQKLHQLLVRVTDSLFIYKPNASKNSVTNGWIRCRFCTFTTSSINRRRKSNVTICYAIYPSLIKNDLV